MPGFTERFPSVNPAGQLASTTALTDPRKIAIVFDFDHTLGDFIPVYERVVNKTIVALNREREENEQIPLITRDEFNHSQSPRTSLGFRFHGKELDGALILFHQLMTTEQVKPEHLFDDTIPTLEFCNSSHIPVVLISNSTSEVVKALTATLNIHGQFTKIIGATDGYEPKPHPASTKAALLAAGVSKDRVLVGIGDSGTDIETIRAAAADIDHQGGVEATLYNHWGLTPTQLAKIKPDYVVKERELEGFVKNASFADAAIRNSCYSWQVRMVMRDHSNERSIRSAL